MILDNNLMDEAEIKKLEADTKKVVNDAIESAAQDDEPPLSELYNDITDDPVGSSTTLIIYKLLTLFLAFIRALNYEDSVFPGGKQW